MTDPLRRLRRPRSTRSWTVLVASSVGVVTLGASPVAAGTASDAGPLPESCPTTGKSVRVADAQALSRALDSAKPGLTIALADGTYSGRFVISRSGQARRPITICGSADAILDPGTNLKYYTLHLDGADHVDVRGITVRQGLKGIMADDWDHGTIDGVTVTGSGEEGIHLRRWSSDSTVSNSRISDTGTADPAVRPDAARFGEGIYVGSAYTNWPKYTGGLPDASDNVRIVGNTISNTTAESIDIKEGTTGGLVSGNTFDGAGMVAADSWLDVKGNDYTIRGNVGSSSPRDGFQTHVQLDGWGNGIHFSENTGRVDAPGHGIRVASQSAGVVVSCTNDLAGAGSGLSNVPCA